LLVFMLLILQLGWSNLKHIATANSKILI